MVCILGLRKLSYFSLFGLLDGRVVGHGIVFGLSALSLVFGADRSLYYEIDTPILTDIVFPENRNFQIN